MAKSVYRVRARVAKLVDALDLGSSSLTGVGVQVPPLAPKKEKQVNVCEAASLSLDASFNPSGIGKAVVVVPAACVEQAYRYVVCNQVGIVAPFGFHQSGVVPTEYVSTHFKPSLVAHLKEFLLKYAVLSFLYRELRAQKIVLAHEPQLARIDLSLGHDAQFHFVYATAQPVPLRDWRYLPFRPPERKKYKDLDKRAKDFLQEETVNEEQAPRPYRVEPRDLVSFDIWVAHESDPNNPAFGTFKENLWLKIGVDESNEPFQELFAHRAVGDIFWSRNRCLQEYFSSQIDTEYTFGIEIKDIVPHAFFSLESFKRHFRLKTSKGTHQKLIEVFSCTNDLLLRHAIVENVFDLLAKHHTVTIPEVSIKQQRDALLEGLRDDPDYMVYKKETDFDDTVMSLAEKQLREIALIDALAYRENVAVCEDDVHCYLTLAQRPRTKEFLYFRHPIINSNDQEYPTPCEWLKQQCLREKTLNYVINHLTEP